MTDLKDISGKYLEGAKDLQASSTKYFVGFSLIIIFCWWYAETVFTKTKYETIRFNRLELKVDSFKRFYGKLSQVQQNEYDSLKKKQEVQDSANTETYKAVEENIPSGFKFILRQATKKPYGILLTSITIFAFLLYFHSTRKRYLLKLSIALRIIKSQVGYNSIYDYNINLPFWVLPINNSMNGIEKKDIIIIGGLSRKNTIHYIYLLLFLTVLIFIQYRLYYISLVTNSYLSDWILVVQSVIFLASILLVVLWLLPERIKDFYNHETYANPDARRNFIVTSILLITGAGLGKFSRVLSSSIIRKILNPRFVSKKKSKRVSNSRKIELKGLEEIENKNFENAANIIFLEISNPKSKRNLRCYIRLFDLIILLCLKNPTLYKKYFSKTIDIAEKSNVEKLKESSRKWQKLTEKKIQKQKKRETWDKRFI